MHLLREGGVGPVPRKGGPARAGNGGPLRAEPASRGGLFLGLAHQSEDPERLGSALAGPTWFAWRALLLART